jgi:hypothetical protein
LATAGQPLLVNKGLLLHHLLHHLLQCTHKRSLYLMKPLLQLLLSVTTCSVLDTGVLQPTPTKAHCCWLTECISVTE